MPKTVVSKAGVQTTKRSNKAKQNIFAMSAGTTSTSFPKATADNTRTKFRVVILDDSPFDAEAVNMLCLSADYDVVVATTAEDAVSLVTSGEHVDVLILDYHQPAPFDALDFVLKIVQGRIPVAVVSADDKIEFLCQCIVPVFVCGVYIKPLTLDNILSLPRVSKIHELTLAQSRWQPPSIFYETSALILGLLRRVLNQQYKLVFLSTNPEETERVLEICSSVGWGLRYICSAVRTEHELEAAVLMSRSEERKGAHEASPGSVSSFGSPGAASDTYDVDDSKETAGQRADLVLIDTQIGNTSLTAALETCQLHSIPAICK
jgi:CheY-like chemotaxis protein